MEWIDKEGVSIKEVVKLSEEDSMYAQTKNTSNLLRTESRKSVRMCRLKCGTIVPEVRIPQTCPPVVWDQMRLNSHKYGGTVHFGQ